jgi:hypothetical protein
MQTFLPYPTYSESMACLDDSRLGNQVYREGKTLIQGGWPNHPASKMWRGYEYTLAKYCMAGVLELSDRGRFYLHHWTFFVDKQAEFDNIGDPPWLGDERLHSSHRANLLRKDPVWYGQFGWTEQPTEGYYWPV